MFQRGRGEYDGEEGGSAEVVEEGWLICSYYNFGFEIPPFYIEKYQT